MKAFRLLTACEQAAARLRDEILHGDLGGTMPPSAHNPAESFNGGNPLAHARIPRRIRFNDAQPALL